MLTKTMLAAATALMLSTALTLPADAKPNTEVRNSVMFWLLDRNNNGEIDKSEVEALRAEIFDTVDLNKDGKITQAEFIDVIGTKQLPREMRGHRDDDRHNDNFAESRGPGPRDGQWQGPRPHDRQCGDHFAQRQGPGPREGMWQGREPHDGPHGDKFAQGYGPGPRPGQMQARGPHDRQCGDHFAQRQGPGPGEGRGQGRGPHDGPHGGQFAQGCGPGPRPGQMQAHRPDDGPRGQQFAGQRNERMMERLGIDAESGLSKDDFLVAPSKLFEDADKDHNGTLSQSEFAQASQHIGRLFILE